MTFKDRKEAGKRLFEALTAYKNHDNAIVLGLPRGGVVVAHEVARKLNVPLDIIVPRKIGAPGYKEFAIGAIAQDGTGVFNDEIIKGYGISREYIDTEVRNEKAEAQRRLKVYRGKRPELNVKNKIVILVDDGIATGYTMLAALKFLKSQNPAKIIVAVPVASPHSLKEIEKEADQVVVLAAPPFFQAVGQFFEEFGQTTDDEVIEIMNS